MREIKFRIWHKEVKKMYNAFSFCDEYIKFHSGSNVLKWKRSEFEPLMQYTGLKDINGKEIYEGDILYAGGLMQLNGKLPKTIGHVPKGKPLKVVFHEGAFKFRHNKRSLNHHLSGASIRYHGLEVVGNIYENKNLLNSEQTSPQRTMSKE